MVSLIVDRQAHLATLVATVVILFKLLVTYVIQGGKRFPAGTRPPEDGMFKELAKDTPQTYGLSPAKADEGKAKRAKEADIRWQRIVQNDLESIPIGLIIAWGTLLSAYSPSVHCGAVATFAVARILHTVFYANAIQPYRAFAWFLAIIAILVMVVNGLMGAFY